MKLLLDENLSRRMLPFLEAHYPGSTQVTLINLERATDQKIWEYAKENEYIIVTKDSDYYDLTLLKGAPPQVIWIQTGNTSKENIVKMLISKKEYIAEFIQQNEPCILIRDRS